jgi:hypothetical protein
MTRSRRRADALAVLSLLLLSSAALLCPGSAAEVGGTLAPYAAGLVGFGGVGWLLARRVPENGIGWSFSLGGVAWALFGLAEALGARALGADPVPTAGRLWLLLPNVAWALPMVLSIQLPLLLLPNGRLLSHRWRWVVRAAALGVVLCLLGFTTYAARIESVDPERDVQNPLGIAALEGGPLVVGLTGAVLMALVLVAGGLCLVLRYRRSQGVERQQLRWVAFGGICAVLSVYVGTVPGVPDEVSTAASALIFAVPASIAVAVLRYRLYDLGRLVSRTLSYAVLSALLVGVYVAVVSTASRIVPADSSLAVATSTLTAAALFQPLRLRVQRVVDSRFNRARYDADRIVAGFTRTLRDEVDLDAVRDDLLRVVDGAIQPAAVGLWLRDS